MESKNIKIIDEHGIDRVANIICAIDVDGSDYVVYWIERDAENDNVFVSKLLKNIDGTSNMINIDDDIEKNKLSDIVKELVKYAIDNEENKLSSKSVILPSGKSVSISSVLFNKEQNINVQRTYITTVKKTVTKVSEVYYDIVVAEPTPVSVVEPKIEPVKEEIPNIVAPVTPTPVDSVSAESVVDAVAPSPVLEPQVDIAPVEPIIPSVAPVGVQTVSVESVVTPVTPVPNTSTFAPEVSVTEPVIEPAPINVSEKINVVEGPKVAETTETIPTPVVEPKIEPVNAPASGRLVFDASNESNLNQALGEVSSEATIPVESIEPVREFGIDQPTVANSVIENVETVVNTPVTPVEQSSNPKAGFANNKFFMVIAIAFFLASCIFLGYEVFNYFQVK